MKITDLSVNRGITAIMLFIGLVVLGFVSYNKMSLDLYPDIEFPVAVIITDYEGAGPKEIESNVTRPIEEIVAGVNNVETITSVSQEGISMVRVEFIWGTDMSLGVSDIREKIDIIKKFLPEDTEPPVVLKFDVSMIPIMVLAVSGDQSRVGLREYAEDELKNLIEQVDGVASATVRGGFQDEIKVDLFRNRMEAYQLSIDQVVNILRLENLNIAGGDVKSPGRKYTLRSQGEFTNLDEIRNVIVAVKNKSPVHLKDIAKIYKAPEDKTEIVRINGRNGIILAVNKQSDKNTVLVCRRILERLEEIKKTAPRGVTIKPLFDQSDYIEMAIGNVTSNAIQGALIAIIVVFIFLRNIRSALILGLSIPVSIITTFIMMYYFDLSLNMMSMGGLALGVGMLIDNSIVILENIFRFREKGARPSEAARLGADEMAMAITASTLTTICVFIPFLFTEGLASQLFREMALTISFSLLCSLLVALTLIPMMTSRFISNTRKSYSGKLVFIEYVFSWTEKHFSLLEEWYGKIISKALVNRKKVVGLTVLSIITGFVLLPVTGMEFMPEQDQNRFTVMAELPVGTNLDTTEKMMKLIEKRIAGVLRENEYRAVSVRAGYGKGFAAAFGETKEHTGKIQLRLTSRSSRKRAEAEIRKEVREAVKDIPGITFNFNQTDQGSSMGGGAAISVEIYGYDYDQSREFTQSVEKRIKKIEGIKDVDVSREEGLPEKVINVNRSKASGMGLNASVVANVIKDNIAGKVASIYRKAGDEFDIRVRLREEDRRTIDDLQNLIINTPSGKQVPLGNIIDIKTTEGPVAIERKKQERVSYITCRAEGRDLNSVVRDIQKEIDKLVKPKNFRVEMAGSFKDMQETFRDLVLALILAMVLIYIIMASQFESLFSPFVIMFTIPTVTFGVMFFLFLTGTTFNVISFMGVLMLSGIVVNNAIVYVDYSNILRARGYDFHEALIEAGKKRLRPILMTTFTTILALIPMALGLNEGSELSAPLARSVIGGLSSSFIFTLVFLPVMYSILDSGITKIKKRIWGKYDR